MDKREGKSKKEYVRNQKSKEKFDREGREKNPYKRAKFFHFPEKS